MKRKIINPIVKNTTTFLKTSSETNGRLTEVEVTLMPGGHNPLHYHKTFSERFIAVEGNLGLKSGFKKKIILHPGESFKANPGELHSFFNPGNKEIKFRVAITPGHEGFENALRIGYGLAEDGLSDARAIPKSLKHKVLMVTMSDTNLPGIYVIFSPLIKWLASRAKKNGVEQYLIDKYCI